MRFTWPEIRARVAAFSERWKTATRESADSQTFWNEFFACYGVDRKQVATYERRVRNLPGDRRGFIDLFWPGTLIVEHKSAGLDLRIAEGQALDYFEWLPEVERPRYILSCDFQRWRLVDLDENGREWAFTLPELKRHAEAFAFVLGVQPRLFRNQKPVDPKTSQLLGRIHKALEAQGYEGHKLQLLLVRLLFILFADDTGVWEKDQFSRLLEQRTQPDGRDLGDWLTRLFQTLDTPEPARQANLHPDLKAFPHVNGALFAERIDTAVFDNETRAALIDAGYHDWGRVSPAIFGALFESVIDKVTRRKQGAHYTPEIAIQRVIGPLFLDDLWAEFEAIRARKDASRPLALKVFHDKLASLRFLDPACGAGNFLVVAYRELRELERELITELHPPETRHLVTDVALLSRLGVEQFYGIEIDEFPSQIAQVALWMTHHIAHTRLGEDFGRHVPSTPLPTFVGIRCADALELDWDAVLPAADCTYVLGNPPFGGSKKQSPTQRQQVRRIAQLGGSGGTLDYVAAWFVRAGAYAREGGARVGFVATNSICQGEQVAQLWPILFDRHQMEIAFAHRTFRWPGRAKVHCVIVGLASRGSEPMPKRLFSYAEPSGEPFETNPEWMTAYLHPIGEAFRFQTVKEASRPLENVPRLVIGSKPIDGGYLIFDVNERAKALVREPAVDDFLRPFVGSEEYLNGGERWILALQDASPASLSGLATIRDRLRFVREYRSGSRLSKDDARENPTKAIEPPGTSSLQLAATPTAYHVTVIPDRPFLVIPETSSERRSYVPIGWLEPPVIPSNLVRVLLDATLYHFAILTSAMHMGWLRHIGGRLKSDVRYSIGLVYNTFPWPDEPAPDARARIEHLAQAVLDARALPKNATSTLAQLYNPDTMPAELHRAHAELDRAVDRLYRPRGFASERERVENLFTRYEELVQPLRAAPRANRRTARRASRASASLPSAGGRRPRGRLP